MTAFLWTTIALFSLAILGSACLLYTQDKVRNLAFLPFDILIYVCLIAWAVRLLP